MHSDIEESTQSVPKDEMLLTFASGVAHNFNNILTAGMGFLSLAMDMTDDKEMLSMLRNVELCHQRISHLARQLLSFTGEAESKETKIFLSESLSNALNIFESFAMKHRSVLVCDFAPVKDVTVVADRFQLVQAFVQILKNAVEACEDRAGVIHFKARIRDNKAMVMITDNGCGIKEDVIEKLSSPFYTTKQVVGVGLGLSTAKSIIERCGGELRITSKPGKGTAVEMAIPLAPVNTLDSSVRLDSLIGGKRVLLAIDAQETCDALSAVLMSYSFLVHAVDNECDLCNELQKTVPGYDLVIVDLLHRDILGDELVALIREYSQVPVVYLYSSCIEKPSESETVAALGKPFEPADLIATLTCFADFVKY